MKKLMFAAALAATGMTFAANYDAQVYDVTLNIKTTAAATAKLNNKANPFVEETESDTVIYRKQANATWKGLIWGCNCETIMGTWGEIEAAEYLDGKHTIKGCILWDNKTKKPVSFGDGTDMTDPESADGCGFGWTVLNAIDKNGSKVEGVWEITQAGVVCKDTEKEYTGDLFHFVGAGFGTLKVAVEKDEDGYRTPLCTTYISKISGNFAGQMKAPNASIADDWSGCTFCGYTPIEGKCDFAEAWNYCDCEDGVAFNEDQTAAYGTWTIAYNGSLSKNLSKPLTKDVVISIRDAYTNMEKKLPYVYAAILAIENTYWQINPCKDYEDAIEEAEKRVDEAKKDQEAVTFEKLTEAVTAAQNARDDKYAQYESEYAAYVATNAIYKASSNEAVKAYAETTNGWKVVYADTSIAKGEGAQALIDELAGNNKAPKEDGIKYGDTIWSTKAKATKDLQDLIDTADEAKDKADADKDNLKTAKDNMDAAKKAYDDAEVALAIAKNNLKNITYLQVEAAKAVQNAEDFLALATKAAENAGCL